MLWCSVSAKSLILFRFPRICRIVALCRILIAKLQKTAATKRLAKCTDTDIGDWCVVNLADRLLTLTPTPTKAMHKFGLVVGGSVFYLSVLSADKVYVYVVLYEFQHFAFKLFLLLYLSELWYSFAKKKIR